MDRILRAVDRGTKWLERQIKDDGSYGASIEDLACYYKSPYLFSLTGHRQAAHRILDHIKERFMLSNGDFATSEQCKSANPVFNEFWGYINGWIAIAAQRMGRFDVAQPAYDYLKTFFHPVIGGFTTQGPYKSGQDIVDVISSSHLGLLSLYFNDLDRAKKVGMFLNSILDQQPDIANKLFLRVDGRGELITTFSREASILHQICVHESNQAYFMIGYPIAFLSKLYLATAERRYLEASQRYLDFAMHTKGNITGFHFSHKVMWGAACLATITGNPKYAEFAKTIAEHLLAIQSQEGRWLASEAFHIGMDQTAEISIWLAETRDELLRFPSLCVQR